MNLFEYIFFIISGPLSMPPRYSNILWFATPLMLVFLPPQNAPFHIALALGLGLLNFALNFYQNQTQTLVTNGVFAELDQATCNEIDALAQRDGITVAKKVLVTNFSHKTTMAGRFCYNAEIYISHHWFENNEARGHLSTDLEILFAGFKKNHLLKTLMVGAFSYAISILALLTLKPVLVAATPYGMYLLILGAVIAQICINYLLAVYARYNMYQTYTLAAQRTGSRAIIDYLTFIDPQFAYDKSVAALPNWKLRIPRFSDLIEHVKSLAA